MSKYFGFLVILLIGISSCRSDEGFTEVDGYKYLLTEIGEFPAEIDECSGLALADELLFVINDGGATKDLLIIDPTDMSETEIELPLPNKDWESVIYSQQDLIIADIGNNKGNRGDLFLHHVDISTMQHVHTTTFRYPDQTTNWTTMHNFDSEGLAVINGKYCMFTKNRTNDQTNIYTAPVYTADFEFIDSITVPLRVTDVYYDESVSTALLLCNQKINDVHMSYLKIMRVDEESLSFSELVTFPIPVNDKLEAITNKGGCSYYLGAEKESGGLGKLYEIEIRGL